MVTLSNYQIESMIYESKNSQIYRGQRSSDRQPVILKMLKHAYPSPEQIAWFKREYEVIRKLNPAPDHGIPGVVVAYSLETEHQRWLMALEDFGGKSLSQLELAGRIELADFLKLAVNLVDILGQIHQRHVIHKDINPSNIIFNPVTGQVKLIDFGISSVLSRENPTLRNPNVLEGTLAYISPEQTGRMNRVIDYRTDFYSLGVTFYELLTGQLPFLAADAIELVHAHLAHYPAPPRERRASLPRPVSDIIAKLMAKNAEDRYQSATGLKADLARCLQEWQANRQITSFPLAQQDVSDQIQISQKLYGREGEIETLLAAFDRVSSPAGASELMLVSGYAGIGKSALVQEIYKPITRQHGYYTAGKFDQFQRNIPYSALIQAFRSLLRQVLTESETDLANWRSRLLEAFGPNGQVIIEVIPEVELIIGPQPATPELGPVEAQNRFNFVFQNFIRVFTQAEHPLVIFLDDLQWVDGASLKLFELLMSAPDSQYLFLIGAYRDNEVGEAHPLMLSLADIQKAGVTVNRILLSPLELLHVSQLLADTLKTTPEQVKALAELVQTKTGGNPFFINEFLKSLYSEALLAFNHNQGVWQWSLADIQRRDITDNVVELMAGKVSHLSAETQTVLKLAACIGNQFDLATLAIVFRKPAQAAAAALWPAVAEGLALPLGETYKLLETDIDLTDGAASGQAGETLPGGISYKFAHDRVQQAVYSLINEQDKQATHYQVGRLLLNSAGEAPEEREQKIFAIVNQLNFGTALIQDQAGRDELAALNLLAGRKAKASAAYEPAYNYLQMGVDLIGESGWSSAYEVTLALHIEAAEAAYLSGRIEQMERLTGVVLARTEVRAEAKAGAYEVQVRGYIAQNNPPAAIKTALQALSLLGINIPEQPGEADIGQSLLKTHAGWSERGIDKLLDLPRMTDPDKLAAIQIISTVMPITYVAAPLLVPILACAMVDLSIEHGNAPASTFGYATYGLVLCGALADFDSGHQFGLLALHLLDRLKAEAYKARTYFYVYLFTTHWKQHLRSTLAPALEAYRSGLETGDIGNSALNALLYCHHAYLAGYELTGIAQEIAQYSQAMRQFKQDFVLLYNELYRYAALSWFQPVPKRPEDAAPTAQSGRVEEADRPFFDDYYEEMLKLSEQTHNRSAIWIIHLNRLMYNSMFQRYGEALENSAQAEPYIDAATGAITNSFFRLHDSLVRLALYPEVQEADKASWLQKVTVNQEKLENWSRHAPMNFLHKFYLVEAERARVLGQFSQARDYYDKAIDLAQAHDYLHEEALAGELAARFYLAQGQSRLAHHYLRDAHYAYRRWGAAVKVKDLEAKYPQVLAGQTRTSLSTATTVVSSPLTTSGTTVSSTLDLASVLKASQTISGEIVLQTLLARIMKIALENAGAERGFLILAKGETTPERMSQWVIEAEAEARTELEVEVRALQSIPVAGSDRLSTAIVNYVARTQEAVVLNEATREGQFTQDAYIVAHQPKSVLCSPLLNQGALIGMVYLENNLSSGAFTPDRLQVLNLLSTQAAISIENAGLYANLEQSEKKYRTLFEDSRDTIFITNPRGEVIDINPAGLELIGYSRSELARINVQELYANPADRSRFRESMERFGGVRDFELKFRRKDGREIDCLVTAAVRYAEDGSVLSYEGIIRDITERKRAEQERLTLDAIQRELAIAEEIQHSLLPPPKPAWSELDVTCYSMPAREVGGDLYAYYAFGSEEAKDKFAVAIGDVSGKGIPAALLMAVSLASFQTAVGQGFEPGALLVHLDQAIGLYTGTSRQNCALVYVEMSVVKGEMADGEEAKREIRARVANAGCIPPIIRRVNGSVEWLEVGGMPLGTSFGRELGYREATATLEQGDLLILSSDGIVEAQNNQGEMFGFEGLEAAVADGESGDSESMLNYLRSRIEAFAQGTEPNDDLTIVVVRA